MSVWKYRGITFNMAYGELGLVALPQVWLFQIRADHLGAGRRSAAAGSWRRNISTTASMSAPIPATACGWWGIYYAIFIVVDLLAAMAVSPWKGARIGASLWWLPLQRFGYRQIMYYVVLRSLWTGAARAAVGWGKLETSRHRSRRGA